VSRHVLLAHAGRSLFTLSESEELPRSSRAAGPERRAWGRSRRRCTGRRRLAYFEPPAC